ERRMRQSEPNPGRRSGDKKNRPENPIWDTAAKLTKEKSVDREHKTSAALEALGRSLQQFTKPSKNAPHPPQPSKPLPGPTQHQTPVRRTEPPAPAASQIPKPAPKIPAPKTIELPKLSHPAATPPTPAKGKSLGHL